jgi:GH15 family glucan-1,4-alpha-glucosidase
MSWAGADRMALVAARHLPDQHDTYRQAADRIRAQILTEARSPAGHLVATYGGQDLDAALLQVVPLRFFDRLDPQANATVDAVRAALSQQGWIFRYASDDGLGRPEVAFVLCNFWLVEALAALGRTDAAREVLQTTLAVASPAGLFAEDYDPRDGRQWGNYPQAYSHTGLIHAAFAASPPWSDLL